MENFCKSPCKICKTIETIYTVSLNKQNYWNRSLFNEFIFFKLCSEKNSVFHIVNGSEKWWVGHF